MTSLSFTNWDGSGSEGDDLYFNVSYNGQTYSFVVESYLCDASSDVYAAVKALEIGQTIDAEGFLYWYEGVNPHHHFSDRCRIKGGRGQFPPLFPGT